MELRKDSPREKMWRLFRVLPGMMLLLQLVMPVSGKPQQIRLSLTPKQDQMLVTWVTPYWAGTSIVAYGKTNQIKELKQRVWTQDNEQYDFRGGYGDNFYARSVRLTGLDPETKYFYRVGNDKQGWSRVFNFRTRAADINGTTTFAVVGDQDVNWESQKVLAQMIQDRNRFNYDFAMIPGDAAYANGDQSKWNEYGRWMQAFSAFYPTMYSIGEQDVENGGTAAWVNRYRHGVTDESLRWGWGTHWYQYKHGPVQIIVLSSEHKSRQEAESQEQFLRETLEAADRPQNRLIRPWIVVVIHRSAYNAPEGERDSQRGLHTNLKTRFLPLYNKFKVNVVVCGHCHNYERTFPMKGSEIVDRKRGWENNPYLAPVYFFKQGQPFPSQGTVHITVGTGGRPVERVGKRPKVEERPCVVKHTWGNVFMGGKSTLERDDDCADGCWSKFNTAYINGDLGFGVFKASRDKLHFRFVSADYPGQIVDEMIMCSMPNCGKAPGVAFKNKWEEKTKSWPNPKQQPKNKRELEPWKDPPKDIPEPGTNFLPVYVPSQQRYAPMPVGMDLNEFLKRYPWSSNIARSGPAEEDPPVGAPPPPPMDNGIALLPSPVAQEPQDNEVELPAPSEARPGSSGVTSGSGAPQTLLIAVVASLVGVSALLFILAAAWKAISFTKEQDGEPEQQATTNTPPADGSAAPGDVSADVPGVLQGAGVQQSAKKMNFHSLPAVWFSPR